MSAPSPLTINKLASGLAATFQEHPTSEDRLQQFLFDNFDKQITFIDSLQLLLTLHEQCTPERQDVLDDIHRAITAAQDSDEYGQDDITKLLKNIYKGNEQLLAILEAHQYRLSSASLMCICQNFDMSKIAQQHLFRHYPTHSFFSLVGGLSLEERSGGSSAFWTGLLDGEQPGIYQISDLQSGFDSSFYRWIANTVNRRNYCMCTIPVTDPKTNESHWISLYIEDPKDNTRSGILTARYLCTSQPADLIELVRKTLEQKNIKLISPKEGKLKTDTRYSAEVNALFLFFCSLQHKLKWRKSYETHADVIAGLPAKAHTCFSRVFPEMSLSELAHQLTSSVHAPEKIMRALLSDKPQLPAKLREENLILLTECLGQKDLATAVKSLIEIIGISDNTSDKEAAILVLSILALASGQYAHLKILKAIGASSAGAIGAHLGYRRIMQPDKENLIKLAQEAAPTPS